MGEWLYYNFAAGSFHTKKLCSRLYSVEVEFYFTKKQKSFFEPPFGGLRGNIRTPSIARWKARGRLIIELFRYLLQLRRYKRKSVEVSVFRRRWVTLGAISDGRGRRRPTTVGVRISEN